MTLCLPGIHFSRILVNLEAPLLLHSFGASGISALAFPVPLRAPGEIIFHMGFCVVGVAS